MLDETVLNSIRRGRITVNIDGKPVMCLDKSSNSFELEMTGLEKMSLKLSDLFVAKTNKGKMLLQSSKQIINLAKKGWKFSIYDKGERLLSVGGLSRFGPHLRISPLGLRRLLRVV